MFEYTHEVLEKGKDKSWGIFPNKGIAKILADELNRKFAKASNTLFIVREIK